jgi:hypothetical protein
MPEPTEPTKPRTPKGAAKPSQEPTEVVPQAVAPPSGAPTSEAVDPTQQLPAGAAAAASGPAGGGGIPPASPPGVGPGGPGGPPPRRPGLWRQATSTTGGTIAVIVAVCLAALMVLGLVAVVGLVAVREVTHHDRADRIEQLREDGNLPPGQQRKLDRLPMAPNAPRGPGQRNGPGDGMGGGMGGGMGNGMGPLMRGALGLGNVQHGEFTTEVDGRTTAMTLQRGEVTKASSTSLTVKSTDGFTATYVIGDDTRGKVDNVEVGDSVLVVAQKAGAKAVLVAATRKG